MNALSASDCAVRVRVISALRNRERRRWSGWFSRPVKWARAGVSLATLSLLAVAAWTLLTPLKMKHPKSEPSALRTPSFAAADTASGNAEVVRVQLSLVPVGDPFLDGSPSESLVFADVTVGSDG